MLWIFKIQTQRQYSKFKPKHNIQNSNPKTNFPFTFFLWTNNLLSTTSFIYDHLCVAIEYLSIMYFNIKISVPYIYLCQWPLSIGFLNFLLSVARRRTEKTMLTRTRKNWLHPLQAPMLVVRCYCSVRGSVT